MDVLLRLSLLGRSRSDGGEPANSPRCQTSSLGFRRVEIAFLIASPPTWSPRRSPCRGRPTALQEEKINTNQTLSAQRCPLLQRAAVLIAGTGARWLHSDVLPQRSALNIGGKRELRQPRQCHRLEPPARRIQRLRRRLRAAAGPDTLYTGLSRSASFYLPRDADPSKGRTAETGRARYLTAR